MDRVRGGCSYTLIREKRVLRNHFRPLTTHLQIGLPTLRHVVAVLSLQCVHVISLNYTCGSCIDASFLVRRFIVGCFGAWRFLVIVCGHVAFKRALFFCVPASPFLYAYGVEYLAYRPR